MMADPVSKLALNAPGRAYRFGMPAERKLVSVLFADLVGSTAMGSETDPEVMRALMARYFERMRAIAETYGGTVEKFIGDAIMVVFGVPRLHEDDAERAVRAALQMQEVLPELNAELGAALAVRIGVNTGEAVAGGGEERQFLVTGDAVNVAARLEQAAAPGEILVGAATEELTRDAIEYAAATSVAAKGKPEPIAAFAALRARSTVPEQARGLPMLRARLVGRQRELLQITDGFVRSAQECRVQLVTVLGDAGVGKSRLVSEVLARIAAAREVVVRRGRCLPYGTAITYWPLMDVIREDCGVLPSDDRQTALARVESRARDALGDEAGAVAARLAVLLGLADPASALSDVAPDRVAAEIAWGFRRFLEARAATTPLVLVVDDLQWAEVPLIAALEQIADSAETVPLLLLCVARRELLESYPDWAAGRTNAMVVSLEPLASRETAELVSALIAELPGPLRDALVSRSGGNPLFCEEFLRGLIDAGRIVQEDGQWRAVGRLDEVVVPKTIQAVVAARLDALPAREKAVLLTASVIGERFTMAQLAALVEDGVGAAPESLMRKGLVSEDPEERLTRGLRFKHLLVRDVAYGALPKAERARLHERFAAQLEAVVGDRVDEFSDILAHHTERAFTLAAELHASGPALEARADRAIRWLRAAGERALKLYATDGAIRHCARALEIALRPEASAPLKELYAARGRAYELQGDYDAAVANYEEMERVARERGDRPLEATALAHQAMVFATESARHDVARATAAFERAFAIARESGDRALVARLLTDWIYVAFWNGRPEDGVAAGMEALAIARELGSREQEAYALNALSRVHQSLGAIAQVREVLREGATIFRDLGNRAMDADCLSSLAYAENLAGEFEACLRLGEEARAITEEIGNVWGRAFALQAIASALAERGDVGEAIRLGEEALALAERVGFLSAVSMGAAEAGLLYVFAGDPARGEALLAQGEDLTRRIFRGWLSYALAARARSAIASGELERAAALLEEARATFRGGVWYSPTFHVQLASVELHLAHRRFNAAAEEARDYAAGHLDKGVRLYVADLHWLEGRAYLGAGDDAAAYAAFVRARHVAKSIGSRRILWRVLASLAELERDAAVAALLRDEAVTIARDVAASLRPLGLDEHFLALPEARALVGVRAQIS